MEVTAQARKDLTTTLSEPLQNLIIEVVKNENLKLVQRAVVTPGSLLGDNYMSVVHRVTLDGLTRDGKSCALSFIIKCRPINKERCEFFSVALLFSNETNFYKHVVPGLQGDTSVIIAVPRCLGTICNGKDDAVVLEDLRTMGFHMRKRHLGLDVPHIRIILHELAKLHALSFALRFRNPEKFKEISKYVKDTFYNNDRRHKFEPFLLYMYEETIKTILKHFSNDNDNHYVKAMKNLAVAGYELLAAIIQGTREHEKVITHGDCWMNNLEFKYDDNDAVIDIRFLDFQFSRVTSPAADVVYILFTSMKHETMSQHYEDIVNEYHTSIDNCLKDLGLSATQLFPRSRLDQEMARCAPYGMAVAAIVGPALYCPLELAPNLETVKGVTEDVFIEEYGKFLKAETKECREHLAGILQFCVDRGYFNDI